MFQLRLMFQLPLAFLFLWLLLSSTASASASSLSSSSSQQDTFPAGKRCSACEITANAILANALLFVKKEERTKEGRGTERGTSRGKATKFTSPEALSIVQSACAAMPTPELFSYCKDIVSEHKVPLMLRLAHGISDDLKEVFCVKIAGECHFEKTEKTAKERAARDKLAEEKNNVEEQGKGVVGGDPQRREIEEKEDIHQQREVDGRVKEKEGATTRQEEDRREEGEAREGASHRRERAVEEDDLKSQQRARLKLELKRKAEAEVMARLQNEKRAAAAGGTPPKKEAKEKKNRVGADGRTMSKEEKREHLRRERKDELRETQQTLKARGGGEKTRNGPSRRTSHDEL